MKKLICAALTLIWITGNISAASAVTPGSKCPKAGQTVTQTGKVFTCIALGKNLYWDNGKLVQTKPSAKSAALVCTESTAGSLNSDKSKRCVMTDDLADNGKGGFKKTFALISEGSIPASTLCRIPDQYWSSQTWYDGVWKCGYFVEGEWSKYGWHKSGTQYPNDMRTNYVVGGSSKTRVPSQPMKTCSTNSGIVKAGLGSDSSQGAGNLIAFIFENTSECNLGISATVTVVCPSGGVLKLSNSIRTTGAFSLRGKESLAVTGLNFNRYFPQALQQCFQLTGYSSNLVHLSNLVGPGPSVMITSATP